MSGLDDTPVVARIPTGRTPSTLREEREVLDRIDTNDDNQITERELDVIKLMARGESNREIADDLFVGEATVKTHVGRILAKLGVQSIQAAVARHLLQRGSESA